MTSQDTFVTRLRRHRERSKISLDEIAARTRIRRDRLDALEHNDLSAWPRGLYARAWVRAYATVVGLDPAETVDEFCRVFPHGDRRAAATLQAMAVIVAHPSDYRDEFTHADRRERATGRRTMAPLPAWRAALARPFQALWLRLALRPAPLRVRPSRLKRVSAELLSVHNE